MFPKGITKVHLEVEERAGTHGINPMPVVATRP